MKIAVPCVGENLTMHFGHCEQFAFFDVDTETKLITGSTFEVAPPHEPGLLPKWISERNVDLVIAGGMGGRAQQLFLSEGVTVITGAASAQAKSVVTDYLQDRLETGENACDH